MLQVPHIASYLTNYHPKTYIVLAKALCYYYVLFCSSQVGPSSVNRSVFTLWALAEAQWRAGQARAAPPARALGSFGVFEVGGKVRVLRPVRAAASGPLETATQLMVNSQQSGLSPDRLRPVRDILWDKFRCICVGLFSLPADNPTKIPYWGRSITTSTSSAPCLDLSINTQNNPRLHHRAYTIN